jgi:hypothetical protein
LETLKVFKKYKHYRKIKHKHRSNIFLAYSTIFHHILTFFQNKTILHGNLCHYTLDNSLTTAYEITTLFITVIYPAPLMPDEISGLKHQFDMPENVFQYDTVGQIGLNSLNIS